jgi:hypothetical protein
MSADKIIHSFKTPLRTSSITSQEPFKILSFESPGVVINDASGLTNSLSISSNNSGYYLTNNGLTVEWKQPTWLDISSASSTIVSAVDKANSINTLVSAFRRTTISQRAPLSTDGLDGDIWFVYQ